MTAILFILSYTFCFFASVCTYSIALFPNPDDPTTDMMRAMAIICWPTFVGLTFWALRRFRRNVIERFKLDQRIGSVS